MNKIAACLMLSTCLLMAPAASATWGNFISTGSATGIGNPSCASVSTGEVACAVRSGKSAIMVNEFNGTTWGAWKSLTGTVSSAPSFRRARRTPWADPGLASSSWVGARAHQ